MQAMTPRELFEEGQKLYHGSGVPKNSAEAERFFRQSANQGYADAQDMMGVFCRFGISVKKV